MVDGTTPQERWRDLLEELGQLAAAYGAEMRAGREQYAAMFTMLSMVHTLAASFADADERRPGWIAKLHFVPLSPDVQRAARLTLTVLADRAI